MKISNLVVVMLLLASAAAAERQARPIPADPSYPFNTLHAERSAAKADTVELVGGPLGNGDFEQNGLPSWDGWFGVDLTEKTESYWQVARYNSPTLTAALWCGETFPSCGEGDSDGGYGNDYEEFVEWSGGVADIGMPTDVTVSMTLNHDAEPGYDYLYLQHRSDDEWTTVATWNGTNAVGGVFTPLEETIAFTVAASDLVNGEVVLRLSGESDGGWSDADCLYASSGLVQIDDISVTGSNGLVGSFDDFESGLESSRWEVAFPVAVGDFAKVWPLLASLDYCKVNQTPQVAFIDDGVVVPCTGGTLGSSWTYGPGGYTHNLTGGCAGPDAHLQNEVWSPPIAWADPHTGVPLGRTHRGALFEYEVYPHLPIGNGLFDVWHVRSSDDGGATWTGWSDRNFWIISQGTTGRRWERVSDLIIDSPTHVQLALGVIELGWVWGLEGTDGTPAPYYDNVSFKVYQIDGPTITTRELDLAQDSFPASGEIDLIDLGSNSIRFDMANDIMGDVAPAILPGDSITFDIATPRAGAELHGKPRLFHTMKPNPLFDPYRLHPTTGSVEGDTVKTTTGVVVPRRWSFDLPDDQLFYPGDIIHYFIYAEDDAGGHVMSTTMPEELDGYGVFPGDPGYRPHVWPSSFTVRGLPTIFDASGDQPPILFYNDFGGRGGENEWVSSLDNLGYVEGVDYDVYYVNAPSSGVSNGLGAMATPEQIMGYDTMLYTFGNLSSYSLNQFDQSSDKSNDLGLLDTWLASGGRHLLATGDNIVTDLLGNQGTAGANFMATWLGVEYHQQDVSGLLGGNLTPEIIATGAYPELDIDLYVDGGCPRLNTFDAVEAVAPAVAIAEWVAPGAYPYAAGVMNTHLGSTVIYFPVDFAYMATPSGSPSGAGILAARTRMLDSILTAFGETGSGLPTPVHEDLPTRLAVSAHPNPFNPSTTIEYAVPREGHVQVRILDLRGAVVTTLVDAPREAGTHTTRWQGRDAAGASVASGLYFYEVRTDAESRRGKLTLLR